MVRKKKLQAVQPEAITPKTKKSSSRRKKESDSSSAEGNLLQVQREYEKVCQQYEDMCKNYVELKLKRETMFAAVKTLEMLLASFNALTCNGEVKLLKPEKGTPYWYIGTLMGPGPHFKVIPCLWNDWSSDQLRYVKGNMFFDQGTALRACRALNAMILKLNYKIL